MEMLAMIIFIILCLVIVICEIYSVLNIEKIKKELREEAKIIDAKRLKIGSKL